MDPRSLWVRVTPADTNNSSFPRLKGPLRPAYVYLNVDEILWVAPSPDGTYIQLKGGAHVVEVAEPIDTFLQIGRRVRIE